VTAEEVKIRDLSRMNRSEWTPPIGAMGGPPAHELYRDLVAHGGLRLLRDRDGNPWVEIQDGERRRAFRVPCVALRGALDRFRMRRNLRPVPESDLEDFARVVAARISDPDVRLPLYEPPESEPSAPLIEVAVPVLEPPEEMDGSPASGPHLEDELARVLEEVETARSNPNAAAATPEPRAPWLEGPDDVARPDPLPLVPSISGARRLGTSSEDGLPRYLHVLRGLAAGGGWLGTLGELGQLTREDPDAVFGSLLKFHAQLAQNQLVVAPVEVEDGWRWLVVDRAMLRSSETAPPVPPDAEPSPEGDAETLGPVPPP
jgi:hypothetical protein